MACKQNEKLALLQLGYQKMAVPMDAALKVMQLLAGAVSVEYVIADSASLGPGKYMVRGEIELAIAALQPSQLVKPDAEMRNEREAEA